MKARISLLVALVLLALVLAGCENTPPAPSSDSNEAFAAGSRIPVEDDVFTISGTVVADVQSLVRQTEAAYGSVAGTAYGTYGSYFGPELGGKGFVRLQVISSDSKLAPKGSIVILKVTDTKASVLLPGDTVEFKCREQYEAVAAVRQSETFDQEKLETWELDYCRLTTPVIGQ